MRDFIKKALSENGEPSSKRLIAFGCATTLNLVILFVVGWDTIRNSIGDKDKFFVVCFIAFDLILLGLATTSQIIGVLKNPTSASQEILNQNKKENDEKD
jgi:hypothetical protein